MTDAKAQKCETCGGRGRVPYNGAAMAVFPDGVDCPDCNGTGLAAQGVPETFRPFNADDYIKTPEEQAEYKKALRELETAETAAQGNPVALSFQRIDDKELQELAASLKLRDGTLSDEEFTLYHLGCDLIASRSEIAALREQLAAAEALNRDHEEVHADKRRLVREIDVIMNGDGAAKQASLCDLVHQIASLVKKLAAAQADARRYAFLRASEYDVSDIIALIVSRGMFMSGLEFDAAMDAAIDASLPAPPTGVK